MEHIFTLAYYLGFTKQDIERMPIQERIWYIHRINEEIQKANEASEGNVHTKGAHDNSPDQRAFRGQRPHTPARLRRFT